MIGALSSTLSSAADLKLLPTDVGRILVISYADLAQYYN
jgi:hypothetical protein